MGIRFNIINIYLYFNRLGKVVDVYIECNVRIVFEVKFFIGKIIFIFFYVSFGNYRSFFFRYCFS